MWYIEKLQIKDIASVPKERTSIIQNRYSNSMNFVLVRIRNSETNEFVDLSSEGGYDSFEQAMLRYSPYGYIPPCTFKDGSVGFSTLYVVTDSMSVKFLDCVSRVSVLDSDAGCSLISYIDALKHWVTVWGADGTILELCSSAGDYACTLFQMLCFFEESGWKDDKFYMRTRYAGSGVCVEFSDVHKARSMLAKAAYIGYDPLVARVQESSWG